MREEEVWGVITQELFETLLEDFTGKFGEPFVQKRLAITFWDPTIDKNVDTRIKGGVSISVRRWISKSVCR